MWAGVLLLLFLEIVPIYIHVCVCVRISSKNSKITYFHNLAETVFIASRSCSLYQELIDPLKEKRACN